MRNSTVRRKNQSRDTAKPQMTDTTAVPAPTTGQGVDQLVTQFLADNPTLAAALATFDVAQEEYRKSLLALTSVHIVTSGTANVEA